jgi:hypothetical protein
MAADLAQLAEALFCSCLQPSENPDGVQVRTVATSTAACASPEAIAEQVAQEFGDHPETAVARMQWCRRMLSAAQLEGAELCRR